jgi:hypothetical protein
MQPRTKAAIPVFTLTLAMAFIAFIPQLSLIYQRGNEWNGTYTPMQGDEFLYSAYVNSLRVGSSRRNDPFGPTADIRHESTFSIQFLPALLLSSLGVSAATSFIFLNLCAVVLATLSLFWLLSLIIESRNLAVAGAAFVLCCGTLITGNGIGALLLGLDVNFMGLLFLRRYNPSATFFLAFLFCGCVWRLLVTQRKIYLAGAAGLFAVLVFSYVYLWTACLTLACCIVGLWAWLRGVNLKQVFAMFGLMALPLIPYCYLLSRRHVNLEQAQTLVSTHAPDLFRVPEVIGLIVIGFLIVSKRRLDHDIAIAAFALMPLIVFNQRIITGYSLQPYHFELFIANYSCLIAVVALMATTRFKRALLWLAPFSLVLGVLEMTLPAVASHPSEEDALVPAFKVLKDKPRGIVFSPEIQVMRMLPTWANQGTLLDIGGVDFGRISKEERKELLFAYLYYCNVTRLEHALNTKTFLASYTASAVFGHERILEFLGAGAPVQADDIQKASQEYDLYVSSFNSSTARRHLIDYAIAPESSDLTVLDRWYHRDLLQRTDTMLVYLLTPKEYPITQYQSPSFRR